MKRFSLVSLVALATLTATNASTAGAAETIGQTFLPDSGCAGDTFFQQASTAEQYSAPSEGVITSWAFQADSSPPSSLRFKVGRPAGENDYTIVGASALVSPEPDILNTYETRISVGSGDQIGFFVAADEAKKCALVTSAGNVIVFLAGDLPPGDTETFATQNQRLLDVSASLELDADGDGFGDETQDQCSGQAGTSNGCPPSSPSAVAPAAAPTGQRADALKKCKKKHSKKARKRCRKKAMKLPV